MNSNKFVTAFAPASIGNVGVGFDMLGLAIAGAGDKVSACISNERGIRIKEVRGLDGEIHPTLSANASENTASIAAKSLWDEAGDDRGIELVVHKGIPLQSGMGSSAASAVAGAVAVNALLDQPLPAESVLKHALAGEEYASGGLHADNVAPSLFGGLVLCPQALLPRIVALPTPKGISSVLLHPELLINTSDSRNRLAKNYSTEQWLTQQGYLAGFVAACLQDDIELLGECLRDEIIEPQRAGSVPCFPAVKAAALQAGAIGCSLSGSGPSIFALCNDGDATNLAMVMEEACINSGLECQSWISSLNSPGARIVDESS